MRDTKQILYFNKVLRLKNLMFFLTVDCLFNHKS